MEIKKPKEAITNKEKKMNKKEEDWIHNEEQIAQLLLSEDFCENVERAYIIAHEIKEAHLAGKLQWGSDMIIDRLHQKVYRNPDNTNFSSDKDGVCVDSLSNQSNL